MAVAASVRTARGHARIKQREGELSRETLETEILNEEVGFDKGKSGLRARQHYPGASSENRLQCPWRVAQPRIGQERSPGRVDRLEKVTPTQR